jgi:hypothetical protein
LLRFCCHPSGAVFVFFLSMLHCCSTLHTINCDTRRLGPSCRPVTEFDQVFRLLNDLPLRPACSQELQYCCGAAIILLKFFNTCFFSGVPILLWCTLLAQIDLRFRFGIRGQLGPWPFGLKENAMACLDTRVCPCFYRQRAAYSFYLLQHIF